MEGSRAATAPGGEVDVSRELEMRFSISLDGAEAAVNSMSRWQCGVLFCLHCPHTEPTWWSPQGSAVLWHSGQTWEEVQWRDTPRQYLRLQQTLLVV